MKHLKLKLESPTLSVSLGGQQQQQERLNAHFPRPPPAGRPMSNKFVSYDFWSQKSRERERERERYDEKEEIE